MKEKKSLLLVVDHDLESPNSVGQMLRTIIRSDCLSNVKKTVFVCNECFVSFSRKTIMGVDQIEAHNEKQCLSAFLHRNPASVWCYKIIQIIVKLTRRGHRFFRTIIIASNLRLVRRRVGADHALYLVFTPEAFVLKARMPYAVFLYDTCLGRPGIDKKTLDIEKKIIKRAIAYYLAPFFYDEYSRLYPEANNVKSLPYPLFPTKDEVISSFSDPKPHGAYGFCYFGQLQQFRNVEEIAELFRRLGLTIDVFSWEQTVKSPALRYHSAVLNKEYFDCLANTEYVLVFDNNEPFSHYMPSKLYQFVAFSKTILVFGKNSNSATKDFLRGYPYYCYFDLRDKNVERSLKEYLNSGVSCSHSFDEKVFDSYNAVLSANAVIATIVKDLGL